MNKNSAATGVLAAKAKALASKIGTGKKSVAAATGAVTGAVKSAMKKAPRIMEQAKALKARIVR